MKDVDTKKFILRRLIGIEKILDEKLIPIHTLLIGNGSEGALRKVDRHEKCIQKTKGAIGLMKWFLGFLGIGFIISILKAFDKI